MPVTEIIATWSELIGIREIDGVRIEKDNMDKQKFTITECMIYNYDTNLWDYIVKTDESILLKREGFEVPPFYTISWVKKSGSPYAIGQAIMVLAELLTMNRTEFLTTYGFAMRAVTQEL